MSKTPSTTITRNEPSTPDDGTTIPSSPSPTHAQTHGKKDEHRNSSSSSTTTTSTGMKTMTNGKNANNTPTHTPTPTCPPPLWTRVKEIASIVWQVLKVLSPPVQNPVLRMVALHLMLTRIFATFVLTLVLSAIAQVIPSLKVPFIDFVMWIGVPPDDFIAPYAKLVRESAKV